MLASEIESFTPGDNQLVAWVKVSGTLRSPEWLLTTYNNQSQPSTFHAVAPEELKP